MARPSLSPLQPGSWALCPTPISSAAQPCPPCPNVPALHTSTSLLPLACPSPGLRCQLSPAPCSSCGAPSTPSPWCSPCASSASPVHQAHPQGAATRQASPLFTAGADSACCTKAPLSGLNIRNVVLPSWRLEVRDQCVGRASSLCRHQVGVWEACPSLSPGFCWLLGQ